MCDPVSAALGVGGMLLSGDSEEDAAHAAYMQRQQAMLPEATRSALFGSGGLGNLMQAPTGSRYDTSLYNTSYGLLTNALGQRDVSAMSLPALRTASYTPVRTVATPQPVAEGFLGSGAAGQTYADALSGALTVKPEYAGILGTAEEGILNQFRTGDFGVSKDIIGRIGQGYEAAIDLDYEKALEQAENEVASRGIVGGTQGRRELFEQAVGPRAAAKAMLRTKLAEAEFADEAAGKTFAYNAAIDIGKYKTDLATKLADNELTRKLLIAQEVRRDELNEKVKLGQMTYDEAVRVEEAQRRQDIDETVYNLERSDKADDRRLAEDLRQTEEKKQVYDQQLSLASGLYNQALTMNEQDLTNYINTIWNVLSAFTGQASVVNAQASQVASSGLDGLDLFRKAYDIGYSLQNPGKKKDQEIPEEAV